MPAADPTVTRVSVMFAFTAPAMGPVALIVPFTVMMTGPPRELIRKRELGIVLNEMAVCPWT